ncbi:MAG: hypothetical protein FWG87_11505 [Defluviitaleaceae bacterium]|nr:hypothetical protein [Defluviitaleaceae bacterium]
MRKKKRKQELQALAAKVERTAIAVIAMACSVFLLFAFVFLWSATNAPVRLNAVDFSSAIAALQNASLFDEDFIQARISLKSKIDAAEELRDNTVVSESGSTIPNTVYWAPQAAHDALNAAINRAKATLGVLEIKSISVMSGNYYTIPLTVEGMPPLTSVTLNFEPEKIMFIEMTDNTAVTPLSWHEPEQGWVAFTYIDNSPNPDPAHTGLVNVPHFYALESGEIEVAVFASWHDTDMGVSGFSGEETEQQPSVNSFADEADVASNVTYLPIPPMRDWSMNILPGQGRDGTGIEFTNRGPRTDREMDIDVSFFTDFEDFVKSRNRTIAEIMGITDGSEE